MRQINLESPFGQVLHQTKAAKNSKRRTVILIIGLFLLLSIFSLGPSILDIIRGIITGPKVVFSFIFNDLDTLKNSNGRTNILLLGIGGEGHQGEDLSDSMMVASIGVKNKDVALISLPRDIWVDSLKAKINSAYAFGEEKQKGEGLKLAKSTVGETLDLPIHYGIRVNFAGFEKAVDLVGGIEVEVEKTFDDYKYPIAGKEEDLCGLTVKQEEVDGQKKTVVYDATGSAYPQDFDPFDCRYEHVHFENGKQLMDGSQALKFVRSRHGTNEEGSDFARARRQQLVLTAFKNKVLSLQTFLDPKKLVDLWGTFGQTIDTDIKVEEVPQFVKIFKLLKDTQSRTMVLDGGKEDSLLENPPEDQYGGAWVLTPKGGNWSRVQDAIHQFLFPPETSTN